MENGTAANLKRWAEKMGYVGPSNPSGFEKLCRNPKTAALWEEVMRVVSPREELDTIRKNIILNRLRNGTVCTKGQVSGSLGTQLHAQQELELLKVKKDTTLKEIESNENAIKDLQSSLKKRACQQVMIKNRICNAQMKRDMFQLKKRDCEAFLEWLKEVNSVAKSLIPQSAVSENEKMHAIINLKKCIEAVEEFQMWKKTADEFDFDDFQSNYESKKNALWHVVSGCIAKISPELLWTSMLDLIEEDASEMAFLASSVDADGVMRKDSEIRNPNQDLSAVYLKCMADVMDYLVKAEILFRRLTNHYKRTADDTLVGNTSLNPNVPQERLFEYLRVHGRVIELEAVKKALIKGVEDLQNKTQNMSSCVKRLKEEQFEITRLDEQIMEAKTDVEQALQSMSDPANKLKSAQKSVEEELVKLSENQSVIFLNCRPYSFCDKRNDRESFLSSTAVSFNSQFVASTPACFPGKFRNNMSFVPDLSQITFVSSADDRALSDNASISIKDVVSTLKKAVSEESKTFMKLPLYPTSGTEPPPSELFSCHQQSLAMVACISKPVSKLCMSLQRVDKLTVIQDIFHKLGHVCAVQLHQLLGAEVSVPKSLCANVCLEYLKQTAQEQDSEKLRQLEEVETTVENANEILGKAKENKITWIERPTQNLIPETTKLHGMNYAQWLTNYETVIKN